jgi:molecular chaperone Hsp33
MAKKILHISDLLHRFIFENTPIRGNLVNLGRTYTSAIQHQNLPLVLRSALGELMAAGALLAATIKMKGAMVLQIQSSGPLKLLVVECTDELSMRATAKWSGDLGNLEFIDLIGDGQFVITLDPRTGSQAYQGIVPLEGNSISEILQNYMQRSEQIETRIWLASDQDSAGGMLLQKLPNQPEQDLDAWSRVIYLAETITQKELLGLPAETLLRRLFAEEDIRLFESQPVRFHCGCSRVSVMSMLRMLGQEEVQSIIEEQGNIQVHCDFCNAEYHFDRIDAEQLFSAEVMPPPVSLARH